MAATVDTQALQPQPDGRWYTLPPEEVAVELDVDAAVGLTQAEADARLAKYGPNAFTVTATEPRWKAFVRQYDDPMQIVLLVAGIGSIWPVHELATGLVVIALTLLNAVLGLRQEGKAAEAVAALQKMMIVKAKVRRDGQLAELPAEKLVVGDVVSIEAGDLVPADGRLLEAATLEVGESALTGESLPVGKGTETVADPETPLGDRTDMVYMNTNVTRGAGKFLVTATGMGTEVGHISHMLQQSGETETPLTKQLTKLTSQILVISGVAVAISIALNLSRGHTFTAVFTAAIAFAIAAIPTGLPAVVTTILSLGTQMLADAGAIVKRLRSTETLGATSAINSDKTGTLTLNQMTATELTIPGRRYTISGNGYSTEGTIKRTAGQSDVPLDEFLFPMILASDAVVRDGEMIGDPTEGALVVLAEKGGLDATTTRETYPRVAELPFDTAYKLMATFHEMRDDSGKDVIRCFVKGAPDQLLARAAFAPDPDLVVTPLDDGFRDRYMAENERLAGQGLRVIATARKDFDPQTFDPHADLLQVIDGVTVLALAGIVDPPRAEAKAAIATAHEAGIRVRMITGDHAVTAQAIATHLGIEGRAITGAEFGALSDDELLEQLDEIGVIARVTPEHKVRLVETLQRKGQIVAMTGDGVNDAPALKKADIGVAMGITGTEVSKEAADMILTDDNFATIVKAVELGRGLYDNLTRYIRFQIGVLIGFIVTFLGASIVNLVGGVPFLPLQTLYVNFTTQVFLAVGLGYGVPSAGLMRRKPRDPEEPMLTRSLLVWLAIAGAVIGLCTLGMIWWGDDHRTVEVARTMGLTTFAFANVFFAIASREERKSILSLDFLEDKKFMLATWLSLAAIILGNELQLFQRILHTVHLSFREWLACLLVGLAIVVFSEVRKVLLRRKPEEEAAGPEPAPVAAAA